MPTLPAWILGDMLLPAYLLLLGFGVVAALGLALLGDGVESLALRPLGPAGIVSGLACFGGTGILTLRLFTLPPGWSLFAAALSALSSVALFFALAGVARRAAQRRAALADLVGAMARVVAPIEPGALGTIATNGVRPSLTLAAFSPENRTLPVGATVVVTALRGEAAEVVPLPGTSAPETP